MVKSVTKILTLIGVCILLICTPVKAEITPQLLTEWSKQPSNVQWNVYNQHTNITVVDSLPWKSPNLNETYAYTALHVNNGYVTSIDMVFKRGCESSLTHEVGHAISNANHSPYWWCYQPCFIQIWQAERLKNPMMPQGRDDIREYFAEAYDMYINYPLILKQTNPSTYNYIQLVLNYT